MEYWEIRDPVYGYIKINELERKIVDNRFLQRLKRIKQLGLVHLVYPGAEHTRFTHSLGTMYLSGKMGERLKELGFIGDDEVQQLRLAGLLHDIGHGPFSHIYEDILFSSRQKTHEDLTTWLTLNSELKDIIESFGFSSKKIAYLAVGKYEGKNDFLNDILVSGFCADILDYLLRDSHYTGVEYGKIDAFRIADSISVVNDKLAVDSAALYALEALVIARYEMFRAVYFHRTVRAASIMIREAMSLVNEEIGLTHFTTPDEFYFLVDEYVIDSILSSNSREKNMIKARELILSILSRKLLKKAYERIFHTQDKFYSSLIKEEDFRSILIERISEKSNIPKKEIYIDFPSILSVPHYPIREFPTFIKEGDKCEIQPLPSLSVLVNALSGYMNIIRVYCKEKYRQKVAQASNEIFGSTHFTFKLSY